MFPLRVIIGGKTSFNMKYELAEEFKKWGNTEAILYRSEDVILGLKHIMAADEILFDTMVHGSLADVRMSSAIMLGRMIDCIRKIKSKYGPINDLLKDAPDLPEAYRDTVKSLPIVDYLKKKNLDDTYLNS